MKDELLIEKLHAEISKLVAETAKINKEVRWYEVVLAMGVAASLMAVGKYLL
jgi:hypothetical protein